MYIAISSAFKVFAKRRMICTYQVGTHAFIAKKQGFSTHYYLLVLVGRLIIPFSRFTPEGKIF